MSIDVVGRAVEALLGDMAASVPRDELDCTFWRDLAVAIKALCSDCCVATTSPAMKEGRRSITTLLGSIGDESLLLDTATTTAGHIRDVLHRFTLLSPYDLAALARSSIDVAVQQLLASTAAGSTQLVFAVCCTQCAAECGRWASVHAVYDAFRVNPVVQCRLCENDVSLCEPHSLQRIKVFVAPLRAPSMFPLACGGVAGAAHQRSGAFDSSIVSPLDVITQLHLSPKALATVLSATPFLPFSSSSIEWYIPRGRYLVLIADAGISVELNVHADPVQGPDLPRARVLLSVEAILKQRLNSAGGTGTATTTIALDAKHGWIQLEFINESPVCGVMQLLPYADRRFIWLAPDVDGGVPSRERMFPATALLARIPGGLANSRLVQLVAPPPCSRLELPSSFVVAAFNLRQLLEWRRDSLQLVEVADAVARVVTNAHHGLVVEATTDMGCVVVVFRSPTAAVTAALCLAKDLLSGRAPTPILSEVFAAIVEGPLYLDCVAVPSILLPMSPLRFHGPALDGARALIANAPLMPLAEGANACAIVLASTSAPMKAESGCVTANTTECPHRPPLRLVPFHNTLAGDALIAPLLEMLPFKFDGMHVEPNVSLRAVANVASSTTEPPALRRGGPVFDTSLDPSNGKQHASVAFTVLCCAVDTCLASTECIALPVVLHPSMVDPYDSTCSDTF